MIDVLKTASTAAGETLLTYFRKELTVSEKTSHQNIVTAADLASQKIIIDILTTQMIKMGIKKENIGFIAEENIDIHDKEHVFIIDPLDGTNNFASGHEYFGISIAYLHNHTLVESLIYYPFYHSFFYAVKNQGAYKENKEKKQKMTFPVKQLKESLVLTYLSSNKIALDKSLPNIIKLHDKTRGIRIFGSVVLDCIHLTDAINNINIVIQSHPHLWDIAAGKLIVEEAGGSFTDWQGYPIQFDFNQPSKTYEILICHPKQLKEILTVIKSA